MKDIDMIYNEDCLNGMKQIDDKSIDLIVTDPPYLINYKTSLRKDKGHRFCSVINNDKASDNNIIKKYLEECYRMLKDNTACYVFCSIKTYPIFLELSLLSGFKVKNTIVWVKNNWTAGDLSHSFGQQYEVVLLLNKGNKKYNGKRLSDVWNFDRVVGKNQIHQNQKPIDLIERCILKHSDINDIVFDGFMGSGTTAIACINTHRKYMGFELDSGYYEKAMERISKHKEQLIIYWSE